MKSTASVYIACLIVLSINACDMINIAEDKSVEVPAATCSPSITGKQAPIFVVNNKVMHQDSVQTLNLKLIKTINVLSPDESTKLYGSAGDYGVVLIETDQQIKN